MKFPSQEQIFSISNEDEFNLQAMNLFAIHYEQNLVYKTFVDLIGKNQPKNFEEIPFLPISFFKTHEVKLEGQAEIVFSSSGTTGSTTSKHFVNDLSWYENSFFKCFELFYGNPKEYTFLGLLPNYLEREGSSLVYMVNRLIQFSKNDLSGFFLNDLDALIERIDKSRKVGKKVFLIGVSYALLDLAEREIDLSECIIMETGGMKGRRKEMTKQALHETLKNGFNLKTIHSEYGMTELLSQAYSSVSGLFQTPPWMKVQLRQVSDPLSPVANKKSGGINVIDLANVNSCPFIATEDLGRLSENNQFEILGRFDHSDVRGCNLMVE